jgi:hypothetical protein
MWSALGNGINNSTNNPAYALAVHDDGSSGGPALYVGGFFASGAGIGAKYITRWDGEAWSHVGNGTNNTVYSIISVNGMSGESPSLFAGGSFTTASGVSVGRGIARWDGTSWHSLGTGVNDKVYALASFDDRMGGGLALYVGGLLTGIGELAVAHAARWDGMQWERLGSTGFVYAFTVFDDGQSGGPALYSAGSSHVSRWTGTAWDDIASSWPNSFFGLAFAMAVFDDGSGDGPALYVGGSFMFLGGAENNIAKWNPVSRTWSSVGVGVNGPVYALAVFDDGSGSGPALYAGGAFTATADNGTSVHHIERWNGDSWHPVSMGMDDAVYVLKMFDDGLGRGPALYAGGIFTTADQATVNYIARWNGMSWSSLGSGMNNWVWAMSVFDAGEGCGPVLDVGGDFTTAGGISANSIARWNGSNWSPFGSGVDEWVLAITTFDDGSGCGPSVFTGSNFATAPAGDSFLAKWQGCPGAPSVPGDITGDGHVNVSDLLAVINAWGPCTATCPPSCPADIAPPGGDCTVGVPDLLFIINNWG